MTKKKDDKDKVSSTGSVSNTDKIKGTHRLDGVSEVEEISKISKTSKIGKVQETSRISSSRKTIAVSAEERARILKTITEEAKKMAAEGMLPESIRQTAIEAVTLAVDSSLIVEEDLKASRKEAAEDSEMSKSADSDRSEENPKEDDDDE